MHPEDDPGTFVFGPDPAPPSAETARPPGEGAPPAELWLSLMARWIGEPGPEPDPAPAAEALPAGHWDGIWG